ncbi:hypothetical protein EJB05_05104, partial [Eragrostis curvula]
MPLPPIVAGTWSDSGLGMSIACLPLLSIVAVRRLSRTAPPCLTPWPSPHEVLDSGSFHKNDTSP